MSDDTKWAFPDDLQPRDEDWAFDLDRVCDAVVRVHAAFPADAYTAEMLGVDRTGSGVVIGDDGLVLTVGYLITEATSVWITTSSGRVVAGHPLAYDQASGFGLVMPLGALGVAPLECGSADGVGVGERMILASFGGRVHACVTRVCARKVFAGYWEYLLDEAVLTSPAHPQWGGAALIDTSGRLVGIGSLLIPDERPGASGQCNVSIPIDLLAPIRGELVSSGRRHAPARPWLGIYASDEDGQVTIAQVARSGPAERAGLRRGDLVLAIGGKRVNRLEDFYRVVWASGDAGCELLCTIAREGSPITLRIQSGDRSDLLKKPLLH